MAETKIEWADYTFNPWIGCAKVAAGCTHCYAEAFAKRYGKATWGENGSRVLTSARNWKLPLKWNRQAAAAGNRPRVFCASLADVFEDWSGPVLNSIGNRWLQCTSCIEPNGAYHRDAVANDGKSYEHACGERFFPLTLADVRADLFRLIDATPNLDWLLLTKRPENIGRMWPGYQDCNDPDCIGSHALRGCHNKRSRYRPNVWLGTSIAWQKDAERNLPELLKCRDLAPILFVSAEPLIGTVDLYRYASIGKLDWLIVGGESGPWARPCYLSAIRLLVEQAKGLGLPVLVKQLGARIEIANDRFQEWPRDGEDLRTVPDDYLPSYQGERCIVRTLDSKGGDPAEWPADLRVRQFPQPERTCNQ